ncbi:DUF3152 domain-containing protein [Nigerium massiliense]|uniref:DUF3152 domain-containing protein n=1 Tax=Nigerium massiliense TaxID=1522317 RepID=UPI000694E30C|nr:DUF3152 domain-containing protein [Nigerium massiliense]
MRTAQSDRGSSQGIEPRQRLVGLAVIVVAAVIIGLLVAFLRPQPQKPGGPVVPASPGAAAQEATPTPTPTPTSSIPEQARTSVWTSDTPATGKYTANTLTAGPARPARSTHDYVVKLETSLTDLDVNAVAEQINKALNDERSWIGYGKDNFKLVDKEGKGVLTIYLVSSKTVDKLCAPLDTGGKWNCRAGNRVILNADRWRYMTPTYDNLDDYRAYMVNHEVGHFLGNGHVTCPTKGGRAPVMMQQSISLGGCQPNAWPRTSD